VGGLGGGAESGGEGVWDTVMKFAHSGRNIDVLVFEKSRVLEKA